MSWRVTLIDTFTSPRPACAPARHLRTRLFDHPFTDLDDEAGLFGDRNELRRRHQAQARPHPAQQRLGADHAAREQVNLGLVVQQQLVAFDRTAQVGLQ